MDFNAQKYYHIEFFAPWESLACDVKVIGFTTPDLVKNLKDSFSIREKYFSEFGLDEDKYASLINEGTVVYVCQPIVGREPIEVDEKDMVFLPAPLLNVAKSYTLTTAERYSFSVITGIKKFDNEIDKDDFIKSIQVQIGKTLQSLVHFAADPISVSTSTVEVLTTQEELDEVTEKQKEVYDAKRVSKHQEAVNREHADSAVYLKTVALEEAAKRYTRLADSFNNSMQEVSSLYETNKEVSQTLETVQTLIKQLLTNLLSGSTNLTKLQEVYGKNGSEAFNQLYNEAKAELNYTD